MGKSRSIIKETIDRLNDRMAIGESRFAAKQAYRSAHPDAPGWTISDNKIHSYQTRNTYQQQTLQFVTWARDTQGVRHLAQLDARRDELVSTYLQNGIDALKSPATLATQRAALRTFFADRSVGQHIQLPRRTRESITRSRKPATRDRDFSRDGNRQLIDFLKATGLRRSEARDLRTHDVYQIKDRWYVTVRNGKGGKAREIPTLRSSEHIIASAIAGKQSGVKVFERIPSHLDVHALRREFAQAMYQQLSERELPPPTGRLKPTDYNPQAVMAVSRALGHNRLDVVLRHYLR